MKILVANFGDVRAWTIPEADVARLRTLAPHAEIVHAQRPQEMLDAIVDADVAFSWRIDRATLARAERLRWIQSPAAGISAAMLSDDLRRRPILLTNSRGVNGVSVAEHAFALILALNRDLHVAAARQATRDWAQNELTERPPRLLEGMTLGLVGMGMIGAALVRIARGFGLRVLATRRRPELGAPEGVDTLLPSTALDRLLRASDIVVLAAPDTRETARLIGARELAAMKRDALFINVGRGGLVDEPALVAALQRGELRAPASTSSPTSRWRPPAPSGRCPTSS